MRKKVGNKYIELLKDNLRGFTLSTNSTDIIIKRDNEYYITTIIIEDKYKIKVGDTIIVDDYSYNVSIIQQLNDIFYCIESPITKTTQFILPMLGKTFPFYDAKDNMYNTYISECYEFIYLVYKFTADEGYLELEAKLQSHSCFIEMVDPNPNLVIMKFKIPSKYWGDVNLIMEGKYKDITERAKISIYKFHGLDTGSRTFNTLYNNVKYRDMLEEELECIIPNELSLMSKPKLKEEIWQESINVN